MGNDYNEEPVYTANNNAAPVDKLKAFLSRFSGLLLFLLTLTIVGLLVFFTIRSASNDGEKAKETIGITEKIENDQKQSTEDRIEITANEDDKEEATEAQTEPNTTEEGAATALDMLRNNAAATDDASSADSATSLPNTGPAEVIGLVAIISAVTYSVARKRQFEA